MDRPIAEVARMSGVTARTLRHYDERGLLTPAQIGANGHRHYGQSQLLRLQQILVLRALGVGLREIARILSEGADEVEALQGLSPRWSSRWVAKWGRLVGSSASAWSCAPLAARSSPSRATSRERKTFSRHQGTA